MNNSTPTLLKRTVMIFGMILVVIGLPFTINLLCIVPLLLVNSGGSDAAIYGVISLTFALLTLGAGAAAYIHGNRALKDKPSDLIRFTMQPMLMVGAFILLLSIGLVFQSSDFALAILFPPIMLVCAMLPPLWAVIWMIPRAQQKQVEEPSLSWRRGLLAFTGGATVSVFIAIVLEILLPVVIFALISDLADTVADSMRVVFRELSSRDVANALTDRGFIYLFIQLAIIAPLAEEIAKPLVVLPLVRNLNKQETFWIGALAGAGFAALENVVYATSGFYIWAGILLVRALGSALHPLGSGLVALGWRDVLRGEKNAGKNWWKRFGIATTVHAVWNGGSLLVISLGGARFFGDLPPEIDILGLSAAGTTLAFLIILGISALWIGRAYGYDKPFLPSEGTSNEERFVPSDRAAAIWAIACLIAIVPAGIAGLKLWLP